MFASTPPSSWVVTPRVCGGFSMVGGGWQVECGGCRTLIFVVDLKDAGTGED